MAIFSHRDMNIPLLTQFVQLEVPDFEEQDSSEDMDEEEKSSAYFDWVHRVLEGLKGTEIDTWVWLQSMMGIVKPLVAEGKAPPDEARKIWENGRKKGYSFIKDDNLSGTDLHLFRLYHLHKVSGLLLPFGVGEQIISEEQNTQVESALGRLKTIRDANLEIEKHEKIIVLNMPELRFAVASLQSEKEGSPESLTRALTKDLMTALTTRNIAYCQSCRNIYQKPASKLSKYCSWRCWNRQRVRRQNQKEADLLPL